MKYACEGRNLKKEYKTRDLRVSDTQTKEGTTVKKIFAMIALFAVALLPTNTIFAAPGDPLVKFGECANGNPHMMADRPSYQDFTATSPLMSGILLYTHRSGGALQSVLVSDEDSPVAEWLWPAGNTNSGTVLLDSAAAVGSPQFIAVTPGTSYRITVTASTGYYWGLCTTSYGMGESGQAQGYDYMFETFLLSSPI